MDFENHSLFGVSAPVTRAIAEYVLSVTEIANLPSSITSLDYTNLDGSYDGYVIEFQNLQFAANGNLFIRTSTNNGVSFNDVAGDYTFVDSGYYTAGASNTSSANASSIQLHQLAAYATQASGRGMNGWIKTNDLSNTTKRKTFLWQVQSPSDGSTSMEITTGSGERTATAAINAIRLYQSAGNIVSGRVKLIGLKKDMTV